MRDLSVGADAVRAETPTSRTRRERLARKIPCGIEESGGTASGAAAEPQGERGGTDLLRHTTTQGGEGGEVASASLGKLAVTKVGLRKEVREWHPSGAIWAPGSERRGGETV